MSKKKWKIEHTVVGTEEYGNKEATALLAFKSRLKGQIKKHHTDRDLLKWLKARNYDVDKAETMYTTSMAYREEMGLDTLMSTYQPPEILEKYLPGGFCGFDKDGSPVLVELYGYTDMKGILYSVKKSDIEKTKLLLGERVNEMLKSQTKKLGRHVDGMTVIIDMDNVSSSILWGPGIQMYAHMGQILQDNYPEIVKRTFIVNAPRILPMLWKLFGPLVTEDMKKKVCILGGDYKSELLQHISADQLPVFLGGTQTDSDGNPRCLSKICQGGTVPEEYYRKDSVSCDNLKTMTVSKSEELKYNIRSLGTVLKWEFMTEDHDIGFGVFYQKDASSEREELVPVKRVNSHWVPEDGSITAEKKGIYTVVFDNSFSWTRAKTVKYNIDVMEHSDDSSVQLDLDSRTKGGSWTAVAAADNETTYL